MDEEKNLAQTPITSQESETEITPEVQGNVNDDDAVTQPTSGADVTSTTSGSGQNDTPVSTWEHEKKSMSGKISKLERDINKYEQEYQQRARLLDALDRAAANDPEFMRLANKKLVEQGVLDESVLQELDKVVPQTKSDGSPKDPAVLWAQQKMQAEQMEREKFFQDFEDRHPDLTEGDPEIVRTNRAAIGAAAAKRMKEGASQSEAYEFAYKLIMNPKQLIEEGKLEGLALGQSALPTEGAASGGAAVSSGRRELTPEQREAARLFGLAEEKFANYIEE
jgi:hypothetical protein